MNQLNNEIKKDLLFFLFLIGLAIIFYSWIVQSGSLLFSGPGGLFTSLGRITGLLAVYGVIIQLLLIGRLAWLERIYGHDKLSIYHHINGLFAWAFIIAHPIFITIGYSINGSIGVISQFVQFITTYNDILNAFIAFVLFGLSIVTSIWIIRRKLKYESWFVIHLLTYAAILLAFGHQLKLGEDFTSPSFRSYWYFLYYFAIGNLLIFRLIMPLYNSYKHKYVVKDIKKENENVMSVYIKGLGLSRLGIKPGQFVIARFLSGDLWREAHPFSVSNTDTDDYIRLSIKAVGDFTSKIKGIKKGTKIILEGPYGRFIEDSAYKDEFLLIAGGIGITPLRSLVESLAAGGNDAVLLYSARTARDLVFRKELDRIAKDKNIKVHYFVNEQASWKGDKRKIDIDVIREYASDFAEREAFICGPPAMMKSLRKQLKSEGIKGKHIHSERFALG